MIASRLPTATVDMTLACTGNQTDQSANSGQGWKWDATLWSAQKHAATFFVRNTVPVMYHGILQGQYESQCLHGGMKTYAMADSVIFNSETVCSDPLGKLIALPGLPSWNLPSDQGIGN